MSRSHFALNWSAEQRTFVAVDFGARWPLLVNGAAVVGSRPLAPGDVLVVGATRIVFESTATATPVAAAAPEVGDAADAERSAERAEGRESAASPPLSARIGRYRVLQELGRGSLSVVYRAYDEASDRYVALKILAEHLKNQEVRGRLRRELSVAARLHHPGILSTLDVGEHEGRPFAALELLEGETLAELIGRHAPMTLMRRLEIADAVCDALSYAHGLGLVHGEVKPSSVMVSQDGCVKLLNFGLTQSANVSGDTGSTMILGTPHYESPERLLGRPVDHRTDIFSLGAVLYELITYKRPFSGDHPWTLMNEILTSSPRPLREHDPGIDPRLEVIVERALEKDPALRYQDITTLRQELATVRERLHG